MTVIEQYNNENRYDIIYSNIICCKKFVEEMVRSVNTCFTGHVLSYFPIHEWPNGTCSYVLSLKHVKKSSQIGQ